MRLNVLNLLKTIGKSKYWLYNQLGMSYQNFNRMVNNETKSIRYDMLDTLCEILQCPLSDLLIQDNGDCVS